MSCNWFMNFVTSSGWLPLFLGWSAVLCIGVAICDSILYWRRKAREARRRWSDSP